MTGVPPKLRSDLTVSQQQTADETCMVVKDPVSGNFFRFRNAEQFIAQQLDGETPLEVIRQRTEAQFGATLPGDIIQAFITTLDRAGLLESADTGRGRRAPKRGRLQGSLLLLRFRLFDPDRLFDRLIPKVAFCFTPRFVVLSAVLILLAVVTAVANWSDVTADLSRLYRLSAIPALVAVVFLVIGAHEFAHGLTCKRFGGEVHEIGFLLIYFQPALYCNVSDAWLFPEKAKRLWVGFAGPYFELFLWALAVLTWRLTAQETWINYVALIVMTTSGIKTLFNFSPLIKLDGYYLLSDYLNIPNLRKRSFRYIGDWIKKLSGWSADPPEAANPRERRIYLTYGLAATIVSFVLLGVATIKMGGFLIDNNQPVALMTFAGLFSSKVRRRIGRLFGNGGDDDEEFGGAGPVRPSREAHQGAPARSSSEHRPGLLARASSESRYGAIWVGPPAEPHGSAMPPKPAPAPDRPKSESDRSKAARRSRRKWRWRLKMLALAATLLAVVVFGRMELRIAGPFSVLPVHNADVRPEIEGILEEMRVTEGDAVRVGDVVARLSAREDRSELQKTEAQIQQARARLRMLQVGATREELELARTAVEKARDRLKYARARLERNQVLAEQGVLTRTEFENTQELADVAENDVAEAENKLKVLVRGARPEEIDATRADLARLEAQQQFLAGQILRVEVRSPATGIVATPARQLREMVGQMVQKGALIAKVYDLKKLTVEIAIPEKEVAEVRVGQPVGLKARAYPNETFRGTVTSIATTALTGAPAGGTAPGPAPSGAAATPRTILVTTEIDNSSLLLKPGMTGQAKVYGGPRSILELMTRRLARTVKVEFWSWW